MVNETAAEGRVMSQEETIRWTAGRKLHVVVAVSNGVMTAEEACQRHCLSHEELASWIEGYERDGFVGLRQTRARQTRSR
jgi:hypothetical protein